MGAPPVTVAAEQFEEAVDRFAQQVIQCLEDSKVTGTNLQTLWNELKRERNDPESSRFRRTEALLGFDPDSVDLQWVENWLLDTGEFGENAISELATGSAAQRFVSSAD